MVTNYRDLGGTLYMFYKIGGAGGGGGGGGVRMRNVRAKIPLPPPPPDSAEVHGGREREVTET